MHILVEISDIPILAIERGLYIVKNIPFQPAPGHSHTYSTENTLIHVDAITHKVQLVPHYSPSKRETHMCGIPMWQAR